MPVPSLRFLGLLWLVIHARFHCGELGTELRQKPLLRHNVKRDMAVNGRTIFRKANKKERTMEERTMGTF
jgi:hypothetical protein